MKFKNAIKYYFRMIKNAFTVVPKGNWGDIKEAIITLLYAIMELIVIVFIMIFLPLLALFYVIKDWNKIKGS